MGKRWATAKKQPTVKEQSATRRTQALANCRFGKHTMSNTFRPGEQVCLSCGIVFYCPGCLKQNDLSPLTNERAYPLDCSTHRHVEVSTCQS